VVSVLDVEVAGLPALAPWSGTEHSE